MKKKIMISLDEHVAEKLENESKSKGLTKSLLVQSYIMENTENRLSKYIARDIENLLLYVLLQTDLKEIDKIKSVEKLEMLKKETNKIKSIKSIYLKEEREKKKEEFKNFWRNILKQLEPNNFKNEILTNGKYDDKKAKKFLINIFNVINENKKIWD